MNGGQPTPIGRASSTFTCVRQLNGDDPSRLLGRFGPPADLMLDLRVCAPYANRGHPGRVPLARLMVTLLGDRELADEGEGLVSEWKPYLAALRAQGYEVVLDGVLVP